MRMTKEEGLKLVQQLIEKFRVGKADYMSRSAKMETGVRRELLDPLFSALGWDVDNSQHLPHQLKEVTHEYSLLTDAETRLVKPDYGFALGGKTHFFVEAKDASIELSKNDKTAFQLQSYSWTAKLPLGILTDFEEFVVFDCRKEPELDKAATRGRYFYCTYEQYIEKWDEIYSLFSKEAVSGGSLDAFRTREMRGAQPVDVAFLNRMDTWRKSLATEIYQKNNTLKRREINEVVQLILDRIIFLRICEDREIEEYGLFVVSSGLMVFPVKAKLSSNQVCHCDHVLRVAVPPSPCLC